jgi:uncharacterized protein
MVAVHVAQLLQAPVGTQRAVEFVEPASDLADDLGLTGTLAGRAKLVRTTHGVLVECTYRVEVERECARCLGIARPTIDSRFSHEFLPTTNVRTGLPETVVGDPDEPRIGADHILDLSEAIRQDIVIMQPLQPLCRPECAGLCPQCGQELNDAPCEHGLEAHGSSDTGLGRLGELLKEKLSQG